MWGEGVLEEVVEEEVVKVSSVGVSQPFRLALVVGRAYPSAE